MKYILKTTTMLEHFQDPIWFIVCKLVFAVIALVMLNINQSLRRVQYVGQELLTLSEHMSLVGLVLLNL